MTALDADTVSRAQPGAAAPTLVFSASAFLSAALLFFVEPMFSKMVLPVLGGSAAVWSVAMVVFQGLLLAGYVYAHLLMRLLPLRHAALVHVAVLALATLLLPIAIGAGFVHPPQSGVSLWLIGLFLASVGLPCFALSANAPLLQAWLAQTGAPNAYHLYRASNLGSFAVLLAYPFAIEPSFGLTQQSRLWSIGYIVLVFAIAASGTLAMRRSGAASAAPAARTKVAARDKLSWAVLGFIPSGLLVAVTAHIATDVASAPFLWIMPLALYLLTFVFAFSDRPPIAPRLMLAAQPFTTALLIVLLLWTGHIGWGLAICGHLAAFFVAAMVCQAELYRRRPAPAQITSFYVWMSLGGVLGGAFAALLAPQIFTTVLEYPLLAVAALLVRPNMWTTPRAAWLKDGAFVLVLGAAVAVPFLFLEQRAAYFAVAVMALAVLTAFQGAHPARLIGLAALLFAVTDLYDISQSAVYRGRSFYAVYRAVDIDGGKYRVLYQGTVAHGGEQIRDDRGRALTARPEPLTYYYRGGSYAGAIEAVRARAGGRLARVALVGLGMGALSCESAPGERWTFYELDPMSDTIARDRSLFRSFSTCAPGAATVIGDGRLTLRETAPGIDLLLLDMFSSDAVPTHMLTREAFALYRARLSPHGAIVVNISNKNVRLAEVVAAAAAENGMITVVRRDPVPTPHTLHLQAEIGLVARSAEDLKALKLGPGWRVVMPAQRAWSDDYSDIFRAMLAKLRE
ncbi:MAG: hypothetical protein WDN01_19595 [Rhizomicrobium sp.]